jgi:hypothetical protein
VTNKTPSPPLSPPPFCITVGTLASLWPDTALRVHVAPSSHCLPPLLVMPWADNGPLPLCLTRRRCCHSRTALRDHIPRYCHGHTALRGSTNHSMSLVAQYLATRPHSWFRLPCCRYLGECSISPGELKALLRLSAAVRSSVVSPLVLKLLAAMAADLRGSQDASFIEFDMSRTGCVGCVCVCVLSHSLRSRFPQTCTADQ